MSKIDNISNWGDFRNGLNISLDSSKAPLGSARVMTNARINDSGSITKRPGVSLLGSYNSDSNGCSGFDVFIKTDVAEEIPIKFYNGKIEYYSPVTLKWETLKTGYTANSNFGFNQGFARTGTVDRIYLGNKNEPDSYWTGVCSKLTTALALTDTSVVVESVLRDDIYLSETILATSINATTAVLSESCVDDQWNDYYIYIKTGTGFAGKIRKITDTDGATKTITFDTLGADPAVDCGIEIRYSDFTASGTIVVDGHEIAYSAMPEYNKFTIVASSVAAANGSAVCSAITEITGNPRGNRLSSLNSRRYIGNVISGLSRSSAGTYHGVSALGSIFVGKVVNGLFPTNDFDAFTYASPRSAGEGDIIATQYGGAGIVDLTPFSDSMYIFKDNSIESVKYSQDTSDLPTFKTISSQYGSQIRTIKGQDDVYFITSDKQFTSLGIVASKGADKELATNLGIPIKRFLQDKTYDKNSRGLSFENRIYIPYKEEATDETTNGLLIYNQGGLFEGNWSMNVDSMAIFNNKAYISSSANANVYQIETGLNDILGDTTSDTKTFPISFEWISNWHNLTNSNFNQQEINLFACEGWITENTKLDFSIYKDFQSESVLDFSFLGTDPQTDSTLSGAFLGSFPLGSEPLAAISNTIDDNGMRHFMFIVFFPNIHAEHISWGVKNNGLDQNFEIIRAGVHLTEDVIFDFSTRIKNLT